MADLLPPACAETTATAPVVSLPDGVPFLSTYYLYLSSGCNLFCRHCWITPDLVQGQGGHGECIDLACLRQAVEEGRELGLSNAKLTGGEPMLHPQFREIVELLTQANLRINMETNGTLIDAAMAAFLAAHRPAVGHISTSLDSLDPRKHDAFRGKRGAFDATLAGIRHLVAAGIKPQVIMSVHRDNVGELEALVNQSAAWGVSSCKINLIGEQGRGTDMHARGETLSLDEILKLARFIRSELAARAPIPVVVLLPPALSPVRGLLASRDGGDTCNVLHVLGILGNGDMALCGIGRNVPELCFGKIGQVSVREAWCNHPVLVELRQGLQGRGRGLCADCIHFARCHAHCLAENYSVTGQLLSPSPLCTAAEAAGRFPPTRRRSWSPSAT